jgi:branched-subunit amino acid transport protein
MQRFFYSSYWGETSSSLRQGLDYIPVGVLAAMIGPAIFSNVNPAHGIHVAFLVATARPLSLIFDTNPLWTMIVGVLVAAWVRLLG